MLVIVHHGSLPLSLRPTGNIACSAKWLIRRSPRAFTSIKGCHFFTKLTSWLKILSRLRKSGVAMRELTVVFLHTWYCTIHKPYPFTLPFCRTNFSGSFPSLLALLFLSIFSVFFSVIHFHLTVHLLFICFVSPLQWGLHIMPCSLFSPIFIPHLRFELTFFHKSTRFVTFPKQTFSRKF